MNLTRLVQSEGPHDCRAGGLPGRFKNEPLADGPRAGHYFTQADSRPARRLYVVLGSGAGSGQASPRREKLAALGW